MDPMQLFGGYAEEFEKSLADDDWDRLAPLFAEDARYIVTGTPFDCTLEGRAAILAGFKRALDGFDRKFDHREIEALGAPTIGPTTVDFSAAVHYKKAGLADLSFTLVETAEFNEAGLIVRIQDAYDAGQDHVTEWLADHSGEFDPSYE